MNFMDKVSKRIIELRESKGETQQELADAINITRQSLSRYELATRTINIDVLGKLAQHFNVTTDYLMGLSDVKSTEQDMKIACEVTGLSEKAMQFFCSFVNNIKEEIKHTESAFKSQVEIGNIFKCMKLNEIDKIDTMIFSKSCLEHTTSWIFENEMFYDILKSIAYLLLEITEKIMLCVELDRNPCCMTDNSFIEEISEIRLALLDIYDYAKKFALDIQEKSLNLYDEIYQYQLKEDTENAEHNTPKK